MEVSEGKRFGRLVVIRQLPYRNSGGNILFECICDCGNITEPSGSQLRSGGTKSCGCLMRDLAGISKRTHGMSKQKEYFIWKTMRQRCFNKNNKDFYLYGGRGITVCDRWKESFENFYEDIGAIPKGMTLDRIDNNGNYCPENCKLSSNMEQSSNKRTNRKIEYKGILKTLSEWAVLTGFCGATIGRRLDAGWSISDALEILPKQGGHYDKVCERKIPKIK